MLSIFEKTRMAELAVSDPGCTDRCVIFRPLLPSPWDCSCNTDLRVVFCEVRFPSQLNGPCDAILTTPRSFPERDCALLGAVPFRRDQTSQAGSFSALWRSFRYS